MKFLIWISAIMLLTSCSTEPVFDDVIFGAEFVTMGEMPKGKLQVSKKKYESSFCPNSLDSYSKDKSRMKNEDGSDVNISGLVDEAILKFMEEHKAVAVFKPRVSFTVGEYKNKLCGAVSGQIVRIK